MPMTRATRNLSGVHVGVFKRFSTASSWNTLTSTHFPLCRYQSSSSSHDRQQNVTPHEFRGVMRKVPSQVVVVTLNVPDKQTKQLGTTCSSFTSVSLHPPTVSFCIRSPSRTSTILQDALTAHFAVHILSKHQTQHSLAYSSPKTQHLFSSFPHHIDASTKLPILHNCLGVLICQPIKSVRVGDHETWFGHVKRIVHGVGSVSGETQMEPLVYYESSYRSIGDEIFMEQIEKGALSFEEWTHRAHLRMAWIYLREAGSKEAAYPYIKKAILTHNATNAHLIKHPYNETITRFYLHLIDLAVRNDNHSGNTKSNEPCDPIPDFLEFLSKHPFLEDRSVIGRYYSPATLISDQAKTTWLGPDRNPLPDSVEKLDKPGLGLEDATPGMCSSLG
ncbi:hypothetical protein SpCBS45565_g06763 [Spizellomyces sp. 'palustris']|nr:hypothetical protein SpCBS45565_g06763 [Spizellomyces sp. 'palustris']